MSEDIDWDRLIDMYERPQPRIIPEDNRIGFDTSKYAHIWVDNKSWIISFKNEDVINESMDDFQLVDIVELKKKYSNEPYKKLDGKKVDVVTWWSRQRDRRSYDGLVFEPVDIDEVPDNYYNIWRGWPLENSEKEPVHCEKFLNFVKDIICSGNDEYNEYLLDWMADAIQNIKSRNDVAIVLTGDEGIGKGFFTDTFGSLFGSHYHSEQDKKRITGQFNWHLRRCLLLHSDDIAWNGLDDNGKLKVMITGKKLSFEGKFSSIVSLPNYMRVIMSSNEKNPVKLSMTSRRYFVLKVSSSKLNDHNDPKYFDNLREEIKNGGREGLYKFLKNRIIKNKIKNFPRTDAFRQIQDYNMTAFVEFWIGMLKKGSLGSINKTSWSNCNVSINKYNLQKLFEEYCEKYRIKIDTKSSLPTQISGGLRDVVPNFASLNKTSSDNYNISSLKECIEYFEKITRRKID